MTEPVRTIVLLAPLAVALAFPTHAAPAAGDPATIVVTGTALPPLAGTQAYGSVTVGADRLDALASGRIEDGLRDVAGFQLFRRTDSRAANPTSQGATLRGLGGNAASRALVLLDGVPLADPFAGYVPWTAIDPRALAAARVTRGGGSGPFGAGAVAGVIELISAGPAADPVRAGAAYGARGSLEADAGITTRLGRGFAAAAGRYDRGDGYLLPAPGQAGRVDVPARYESWSATLRGVVPLGDDVELQARGLAFDDRRLRGLPGTENGSRGADASLRLVGRGRLAWEALAYVQARSFSSGFASADATRTVVTRTLDQYSTPATGLGAKVELRPSVGPAHELQVGLDLRSAAGETNELFRPVGGEFTRARNAGGRTLVAGLYAENGWTVSDQLTLTAGARLDRWTIGNGRLVERDVATGAATLTTLPPGRSGWRPTARAGVLLSPAGAPALKLRAAAYLGWRLPTLNELFRPFRVGLDAVAPNPDLRPETSRGAEAGVDFAPLDGARLGLTAFWNRLDDAVGNVTLAGGPGIFPNVGFVAAGGAFRQRLNLDAIGSRGIEAFGSLRFGDWSATASYALTDARVEADGPAAALNGRRPAQTPLHQASTTLAWNPTGGTFASATLRYVGPQFEDDLSTRRLGDALTVDAAARVPLAPRLGLTLRAENLFDALIPAGITGGVIDRGTPRTLWIGIRLGG